MNGKPTKRGDTFPANEGAEEKWKRWSWMNMEQSEVKLSSAINFLILGRVRGC